MVGKPRWKEFEAAGHIEFKGEGEMSVGRQLPSFNWDQSL